MNAHWLAHLDAHIATGKVAAEAESAETLGHLLKLEPEERWTLILNRDVCLDRLLAADYRRLLTLLVRLEPTALPELAAADHAPRHPLRRANPPPLALSPAPPQPPVPSPPPRAGWWLAVPLLVLAGTAGAFWLSQQDGWRQLVAFEQEARARLGILEQHRSLVETLSQRLAGAEQSSARQRQLLRAFAALDALDGRLAGGRPFAAELAAFQSVWSAPAQLAPLEPLARTGIPPSAALIAELSQRCDQIDTQWREALDQARRGQLGAGDLYLSIRSLMTRRALLVEALAYARADQWRAAAALLEPADDPAIQAWRARAAERLLAEELLAECWSALWSDWNAAAPSAPADGDTSGRDVS